MGDLTGDGTVGKGQTWGSKVGIKGAMGEEIHQVEKPRAAVSGLGDWVAVAFPAIGRGEGELLGGGELSVGHMELICL